MNNAPHTEAQAATWLIQRDAREPTPDENAAFNHWLAQDPRHRAAYLRLETAWKRADRLKQLHPEEGTPRPPKFNTMTPTTRWAIAATILLTAAAGLTLALNLNTGKTYTTGFGGFERLVLPDGSTVELNTGSEIRVHLTDQHRQITLVHGEATFKVAHDPTRPFNVQAGQTTVQALGTAFSVRLRDHDQLDVLVTEGQVAIRPLDLTIAKTQITAPVPTVSAGEIATVDKEATAVTRLQSKDMTRRLAWTTGRLIFDGQTLTDAVAEFNRYNRRQLVIADPTLAQLHVGGSFAATDLESFTDALKRTAGVHVETTDADNLRLTSAE